MGLRILGIALLVYGVFVVLLALLKPKGIWGMAKIQGFVKMLGEKGTTVFLLVFGVVALGFGVWLTFLYQTPV